MLFDILTIFPGLFESPLKESIIKRAQQQGQVEISLVDIREFATDKHAMTDDRPFGGGEGMVMKPEPLSKALSSCRRHGGSSRVILLSPQGRLFSQAMARELAEEQHLVLICGRYEGVDERFRSRYVTDEISIGDYVLTGGELGALVVVDAVSRLLPGVLGCSASAENDTFSRNLLKHPQYTRPREFEGIDVPEELLSGDHKKIAEFRFLASVTRTLERRPDLLESERFSKSERKLLKKHGLYDSIENLRVRQNEQ